MMKKLLSMIAAVSVIALVSGCANQGSTVQTKRGAVGGAAVGAIVGGIIGHQSGRGLEGAAVGGAVGAAGGALAGSAQDEQATREETGY
jgi:uncharacterized protein YcfJ